MEKNADQKKPRKRRAPKISDSDSDNDIVLEINDFTVDLDEFESIRKVTTSNNPKVGSGYYRQRSYSKEDVKISKNVLLNTGTTSPEFVISDENESINEQERYDNPSNQGTAIYRKSHTGPNED